MPSHDRKNDPPNSARNSIWEPLPPVRETLTGSQKTGLGRLILRSVALGLVTVLFLTLLAMGSALGVYAYYGASLPSPRELYERTTPFKSTKIYDRHGELLFEIFDPLGGRRTLVDMDDIPGVVVEAVVATEDATFFSNPGVSPLAIARALYTDLHEGEIVQGGSTITQQLVKNLFLTNERKLSRKVKETILSAEITRRYSKTEILEIYLNEVYFGNLAYGIGAAAETYFGKEVEDLNLAEAALLVGLLQSPARYDPYTNPEAALVRRRTVLRLMREEGYVTQAQFEAANAEPLDLQPQEIVMKAPHMVMHVRQELEDLYGTERLYNGGLQVYTTLDLQTQRLAKEIAQKHIVDLSKRGATNASVVVMDPYTGQVLAMLGSVDFYDRSIDGQVNVATTLQQPGSAIKPFTYLAALEQGWTAGTMLMDVEQSFPDGANPPYKPTNYDHEEWGPVSLRTALACSRNIPAVYTLHQVGLPALLEVTSRLGIRSLDREDYGLSLTLGGGDVTLLEMTAAYGALANGGRRVTPQTILYITDQQGDVVLPEATPKMPQVMDPRHAYLLTDILADNETRARAFGSNNPLMLSFPSAAKTGTTNDYRDSWTIGYTPRLVTGVWVGNSDNTPMDGLSGTKGAGLIWHDFMEAALGSEPQPDFLRPEGLVEVEVCPISGQKHTELCPPPRRELFLEENAPPLCTVHKRLKVCKITGKLATQFCPEESVEEKVYEDYGPAWDEWAREQGLDVPPREMCDLHNAPARVSLNPFSGPLEAIVEVRGSAEAPDFGYYVVERGVGSDPERWRRITPEIKAQVTDGVLCRWDTHGLENGTYTLRLVVADRHGHLYEAREVVSLENATPTPSPTVSPTPSMTCTATREPTPTASWTPTPTDSPTALPTATALPTFTWTPTPVPSSTPSTTSTPSATPSQTPTNTPRPPTATATFSLYP
ncbi:MAG: penicillin-binding protein 1C [Chloroflexota bacterium]|nr:penicillin-binding protein 1C [Chloroflexota bacterium]